MEPNAFNNAVTTLAGGTKVQLDGTNYVLWRQSMESVLQSKGLYRFITPRAEILKARYQERDDLDKLEELTQGDEMALGQIKCHIVPSYLDVVANCTSAIDAWKITVVHLQRDEAGSGWLVGAGGQRRQDGERGEQGEEAAARNSCDQVLVNND